MITKLCVAVAIVLACLAANAAQEMPQQMWWDIYVTYQYVVTGPKDKAEQRREEWSAMSDAQKDAATPKSVREKWLNMSLVERQKASQDAWNYLQSLH
jgi:hypothetical protein